jgi:putative DeoR family transcriptional regulator, stage III sporulation protein D
MNYIARRALKVAEFFINEKATVRIAAKKFKIGKSTVHKDLTCRLPQIDLSLTEKAYKILMINKRERHIRGGMATKRKFKEDFK